MTSRTEAGNFCQPLQCHLDVPTQVPTIDAAAATQRQSCGPKAAALRRINQGS
jgi:hypothetical protein